MRLAPGSLRPAGAEVVRYRLPAGGPWRLTCLDEAVALHPDCGASRVEIPGFRAEAPVVRRRHAHPQPDDGVCRRGSTARTLRNGHRWPWPKFD